MKGAGDLIAFITKITGIKAVVKWYSKATGRDCGCDLRQEKMNIKIPFNGSKQDV